MQPKEIKTRIKKHIARGETEEAINLLLNYSEEIGCATQDEIILISGQYMQWQREKMLGVEPSSAEVRRIQMALLEIVDKRLGKNLRHTRPAPSTAQQSSSVSPPKSKNNLVPILIGVAFVIAIGVGAVVFMNNGQGSTQASLESAKVVDESKANQDAAKEEGKTEKEAIGNSEKNKSNQTPKQENPSTQNTSTSTKKTTQQPSVPKTKAPTKRPPRKVLTRGQRLNEGEEMTSPNGTYNLIVQDNGDLAIYKNELMPVWATMTSGNGRGAKLVLENSGNLVLYNGRGKIIWASETTGGVKLNLENSGKIVLYDSAGKVIWESQRFQ